MDANEKRIREMLKERSWKKWVIVGIIMICFGSLLETSLFTLILTLLEFILGVGGLIAVGYGIYLAYPIVKKKYRV